MWANNFCCQSQRVPACTRTYAQYSPKLCVLLLVSVILLTFGQASRTWYDLSSDINNCSSCDTLMMAVGEAFDKSMDANFTVQDYIHVFIGMWGVTICKADNLCYDMTLCAANQQLESVQLFKHALG